MLLSIGCRRHARLFLKSGKEIILGYESRSVGDLVYGQIRLGEKGNGMADPHILDIIFQIYAGQSLEDLGEVVGGLPHCIRDTLNAQIRVAEVLLYGGLRLLHDLPIDVILIQATVLQGFQVLVEELQEPFFCLL